VTEPHAIASERSEHKGDASPQGFNLKEPGSRLTT